MPSRTCYFRFLVPVLVLTVVMNVTKFFEIHIVYPPVVDPETGNLTDESPRPALQVSEFSNRIKVCILQSSTSLDSISS